MKIKNLIKELSRFDPELEVYYFSSTAAEYSEIVEMDEICLVYKDSVTDYISLTDNIEAALDEFTAELDLKDSTSAAKRLEPCILMS